MGKRRRKIGDVLYELEVTHNETTGRAYFTWVPVTPQELKTEREIREGLHPTADELPPVDPRTGERATQRINCRAFGEAGTFSSHTAEALEKTEERREAVWEQYKRGSGKER